MENFIKFIESIHPLSSDTLKQLLEATSVVSYKSGEHLTEIGKTSQKFFFVTEGGIRSYSKGDNGNEINISISFNGSFAASLKSLIFNQPSEIGYQAMVDCVVLEAPLEKINNLKKTNQDFSDFMYKLIELEYNKLQQSYIELLSKDATERYLILRTKIKNIDQLVPQFQIASHLGITPIQLSRIRKKLFNNTNTISV